MYMSLQKLMKKNMINILKDKSHLAKKTKINIHKDIFDDDRNDPRLYGSSSYSDEKKTVVHNGVFTSCKINNNCPPWSIKAKKNYP